MTLVNVLIVSGIAMSMLYAGLLFDPAWANLDNIRGKLRPFVSLTAVNYLVVPLVTAAMIWMVPVNPTLTLTLLTLAALPCAPLVPVLITLAAEPPEWPLFVFLGFSALSLIFVTALVAILANSSAYSANIGADTAEKLLQYVLMVYGPMTLGALWRLLAPGSAARMLGPARALTGICFAGILTSFATIHRHEFALVSRIDLLLIFVFVAYCSLFGALTGARIAGGRLTATISTGFRNIALGIAFATVVLRRPDVTAYMVVYSAITLLAFGLLLTGRKLFRHRAARK